MGNGIKLSRCAVFDVKYHYFPESGKVIMPDVYDKEYILGIGLEKLAHATHDNAWVSELVSSAPVYLEDESDIDKWNTDYTEKKFSNPIDKITSDDSGDFDLYAKWTQFVYKKSDLYTANKSQSNILLEKNDLLFSWNNGGTTPSFKTSKSQSNILLEKDDLLFSWKR